MKTLELSRDELRLLQQWIEAQLDQAKGGLSVQQYHVLLTLTAVPARLRSQYWRMQVSRTVRPRLKSVEVAALWQLMASPAPVEISYWGQNVLQQVKDHLHYVLTQQLGHSPTLD